MNPKRILLVEDEIISSESLKRKLIRFGYEVLSVITTGEDVVKNIEELKPDLILMDINLAGEMDGIEAASIIQTKTDVPIIYVTVFEDDKILQRALNTSPYNYLSKPVSDQDLNNAIEIALHRHNIEKLFKLREKWLETLLTNMKDAVMITDDKGSVTYLNSFAEKLTGWELEDAIGVSHLEILKLMFENETNDSESPVLSALKYNISIDFQPGTFILSKKNTRTFIKGKVIPFSDDNGVLSGSLLMFHDSESHSKSMTNNESDQLESKIIQRTAELMEENVGRKKAEESLQTTEEKYRRIVETSLEGIWLSDKNFKTTFVNRRMAEMLGSTVEELFDSGMPDHINPEHRDLLLKEVNSNALSDGNVMELLFNCKDGRSLWALVSTNILHGDSGEPLGILSMVTDITDRKHAESEMQAARTKAEESSRLKSVLIMNMNHELRTPMNGILGFASLLKDEITDPAHAEIMKDIYDSGNRLMNTLNSIMEFAMLESGHVKPNIEECNLKSVLQSVSDVFSVKAAEKGLMFSSKIDTADVIVKTDSEMLKTVFSNVIDNAVRFTEKGGVIIEASISAEENKTGAVISICDTGIGISREKHELIFDEFKQVSEGYGRSHEGIGLGLSIAKRIAALLDVDLFLDSSNSNGTIFKIRINVERDVHKKYRKQTAKEHDIVADIPKDNDVITELKEILIIEDNKQNIDLAVLFLKKIYKVSFAYTGEKAVEMAEKKQYSLILTDVNLGAGIDGIQTQKIIRKIPGYENIPNIVVTGYSTSEDRQRLLKEGFDDFISKPYTRVMLIQAVQRQLGKQR